MTQNLELFRPSLNDKSGWYEFSILPDLSVYARAKDHRTGIYGCYPY
jgi:hypothetical protein